LITHNDKDNQEHVNRHDDSKGKPMYKKRVPISVLYTFYFVKIVPSASILDWQHCQNVKQDSDIQKDCMCCSTKYVKFLKA